MLLLPILLYICFLAAPAVANVEKEIFTAPKSVAFENVRPNLIDLHLETLSPKKLAIRTSLPVSFPARKHPFGTHSWYLLHGLRPGQRYEVRICWAATQPSSFFLELLPTDLVFAIPDLIQDLSKYAEERQSLLVGEDFYDFNEPTAVAKSALFLRIRSAADFYTSNKELMQHPPPVDVDIILDPYLLNILPQSLLPTATYILLLAIGSWFLSGVAWKKLQSFVQKQHVD